MLNNYGVKKRERVQGIPSKLPKTGNWCLQFSSLNTKKHLWQWMCLCIPRLHLGMLIHRTNLVHLIYLMEGLGETIFKSSCSATWPLDIQESYLGEEQKVPFNICLYSRQIKTAWVLSCPVCYTTLPIIELLSLFLSSSFESQD